MKHFGKCKCGNCEVVIEAPFDLGELVPRMCDCDYCALHSSAMVSHPQLAIVISATTSGLKLGSNGSGQATFYQCKNCDQLLAVGATLSGVSMGAVNALMFGGLDKFSEPVSIQPRLLSPSDKAARWAKIWGSLKICDA